jgi:hypothetical protein
MICTGSKNVHPQHPPDQVESDDRHDNVANPLPGSLRFSSVRQGLIVAFPRDTGRSNSSASALKATLADSAPLSTWMCEDSAYN